MSKPKVVAVVGPTSSGKTALSIEIAKRYDGEVVSADSRQVYRGMDLGSGKITHAEMAGVPHHLLDVADPMTVYTSADFKHDAEAAIEGILQRGRLPIIAGGSFFYLELLRGNMQAAPVGPNPEFRKKLEAFSDTELLGRLKEKDARRAETIDPHNRRRLIRSLEIIEALGAVPEPTPASSNYEWLVLGIDIDQETLLQNIHTRLFERIESGMIQEAESLHAAGVTWERMDELGLEYRYLAAYLSGKMQKTAMIEELETKSRQFAKRQMTWLKRDGSIEWVEPKNLEAAFRQIESFLAG